MLLCIQERKDCWGAGGWEWKNGNKNLEGEIDRSPPCAVGGQWDSKEVQPQVFSLLKANVHYQAVEKTIKCETAAMSPAPKA